MRPIAAVAFFLVLLAPTQLLAQARELHWPAVDVTAHLDADGRLRVTEVQSMMFTGYWNGGERSFIVKPGQKLTLRALTRLDVATGARTRLSAGKLSALDRFAWTNERTLRWRSRLPKDPPFDHTLLTYVIEVDYENVLQPQDDGTFTLAHDFAFAERSGVIESFSLSLTLDPVWQPSEVFSGTYGASALPPGQGFVVTVPLAYEGKGTPSAVRFGASKSARQALTWASLLLLLLGFLRMLLREHRLGRFLPLPDRSQLTPAWLQENVFARLPEVVGAMWDDRTAAPEVAAILARLIAEKKLSSQVRTTKKWIFKSTVLELKLEVPRTAFVGHEGRLINALFRKNEKVTDTDKVRARYRSRGFNPAALISKQLDKKIERDAPNGKQGKPSFWPTLGLLLAGGSALGLGALDGEIDVLFAMSVVGISLPVYGLATWQAVLWRSRVNGLWPHLLRVVIPLSAGVALAYAMLEDNPVRAGVLSLSGMCLWLLGLSSSIFNQASSRQSRERIAVRKQLAAAREFFRVELKRPTPQLEDAWFPYLVAFGLGPEVDHWFRAFGGASVATTAATGFASSGGSGSAPFTGGGGAFGGAGASASFTTAVSGISSGVPSPSSGGSGGGGSSSGGGSSGGGGGGGW